MKAHNVLKLTLIAALALTGCATQKSYVATGGSRADGTIELSYEYGGFEVPEVNEAQGLSEARSRCAVWGYTGASAFGGAVEQCLNPDFLGGCNRRRITKSYQCTGGN